MDGSPPTFMVQFTWDQCVEHATSEEWPLGDAVLKRVTTDGSPPTFKVQFTWDPCAEHGAGRHCPARQKSNRITEHKDKPTSTSRRARYTPADDAKILRLKVQGLSWIEIAEQFPGRSAGAIEVRYHTKLKTAEWEVEEICGHRRGDDGGLELLVRNMAETQALDEYERLHGRVTVDTISGKWYQ
ncbi:hypothetical protein C7999DRAFT_44716 [Corynascus novoguineensis]|uniref:Myb-like domain-containing protein n=1 Tax=Corynascus novoguineensis TaxID=1126955 RepID=A0AAN7HIJ4_9PEZI|nr:hypothetical protein C7999DRAFT_44716 [Corynascus novoguineensis]